jgi:hypothetical protein
MSDLLRDYELKRRRAMHHFDVLRESVERFTDIDREPVPGEFDPNAGQYVFKATLEPTDTEWTVLLGDFLYDTRASLDYLITTLIRSTGKQEHDRSEFPIYSISDRVGPQDIDQWWEDGCGGKLKRQLQDTPSGTKAALKKLQPFYGGPSRSDPHRHPLWVLYTLSNRDKHRRLNLLIRGTPPELVNAAGEPIFQRAGPEMAIPQTYEGNTYTVTLTTHDALDVDVYFLPTYNVRLREPPEAIGNLIETLTRINQCIDRWVLPTVRALL